MMSIDQFRRIRLGVIVCLLLEQQHKYPVNCARRCSFVFVDFPAIISYISAVGCWPLKQIKSNRYEMSLASGFFFFFWIHFRIFGIIGMLQDSLPGDFLTISNNLDGRMLHIGYGGPVASFQDSFECCPLILGTLRDVFRDSLSGVCPFSLKQYS